MNLPGSSASAMPELGNRMAIIIKQQPVTRDPAMKICKCLFTRKAAEILFCLATSLLPGRIPLNIMGLISGNRGKSASFYLQSAGSKGRLLIKLRNSWPLFWGG